MVVRNTSGIACIGNVIGSPVRVIDLRYFNLLGYGPAWDYAPALRCPKCGGELDLLLDADLQPIRPAPAETVREIIAEMTA